MEGTIVVKHGNHRQRGQRLKMILAKKLFKVF